MKSNRLIVVKAGLITAIVVAISFIGCTTEEEPGPTDARDKYIGNWSCEETDASNVESTFNVNITKKTSDSTRIFIGNINNIGSSYKPEAVVNGNSITIPVFNAQGYTVSGSGSYSSASGKVSLSYTVNDGNNNENYTAILTK